MKLTRKELLRVAKVLETFLAEAAVLIAVFPVLDVYVQYGGKGVTWKLLGISFGLASALLASAFSLAILEEED